MKRAVEEREETEHPPELHQRIDAENLSQRRYCNRETEKDQGQHPGCSRCELQRIWANSFVVEIPKEQRERHQRVNEDDELREGHNFRSTSPGPFPCRG